MNYFTLTQCMQLLAINNHKLKKLLEDASIIPEVSSNDRRIRLVTEQQFAQLRAAIAAYPHDQPQPTTTNQQINDLQQRVARLETLLGNRTPPKHLSTIGTIEERTSVNTLPNHTQQTAENKLPPGCIGWREWAHLHGIPETTIQKAKDAGRLSTIKGRWKRDRVWLTEILDPESQQTAYTLWQNSPNFRPCEHCPSQHT